MNQSFEGVWTECEELFAQARTALKDLQTPQASHLARAHLNALFRATHTLKGMAAMLGFPALSQAAHRLEDLFDLVRQGRLSVTETFLETLASGIQALEDGLEGLKRGRPEPTDHLQAIRRQMGELEALALPLEGTAPNLCALLDLPASAREALSAQERLRTTAVLLEGLPVRGLLLNLDLATFDARLRAVSAALAAQGEILSTLPWEAPAGTDGITFLVLAASADLDLEALGLLPGELGSCRLLAEPSQVPLGLRKPVALAPAPREAAAPEVAFLRLPVQWVDDLEVRLQGVEQLRDQASHLLGPGQAAPAEAPLALLADMEEGLMEVQHALLQMRMVRVETLFSRLEALAKSLARDSGKPLAITFRGGDLAVERDLLGRLAEPFLHLIRNALDHGLEGPAARRSAGKPEAGTLGISAAQQGRHLCFQLQDDGRGFDLARIAARGRTLGLLGEEPSSPEALLRLVLEPGFSTREEVTELSGRGVGLDVVRSQVEALGGELHLSSEAGRGSLISLLLPLHRVVLACLKVRCGQHTFGLPLESVLRVRAGRIPLVCGAPVQELGRVVPMTSLLACLGLPAPETHPAFVLVEDGHEGIALGVDEVLGKGNVLLRSLPELARVPGIMGGAHREDGILWVLDPREAMELAGLAQARRLAHV